MVRTKPPGDSNEPVLSRILREAWDYSRSGRTFLAVFDLDSTLYDLTLRVSTIVDEFAFKPENRARFPSECERLKDVKIELRDWGLEKPLARLGLPAGTAFFKALHDHWAEWFFHDAFLSHDRPLPGAVEFVQELHQIGAHVMYLSGRDIPRMGKGTQESLRAYQFPLLLPSARLVLKPRADMIDEQFKLDVLLQAEEEYDRIWLFENEPVNLNLIAKHCPEIGLVFIDSTHSGRQELEPVLDTIPHFEVDIEEFRKR